MRFFRFIRFICFFGRWLAWAWWDAREGGDACWRGYDQATRRKLMKRRAEKEPLWDFEN